jgi:hypothetical protein
LPISKAIRSWQILCTSIACSSGEDKYELQLLCTTSIEPWTHPC